MDNSKYLIQIGDADFTVCGTTVAWDAYERALAFADLTGDRVMLFDSTGELLIDSEEEDID